MGLIGSLPRERPLPVEIAAVGAGVGIHAVQNHPDTVFMGSLAHGLKILQSAQHGVGVPVVAGIIAVVGIGLADGVEVDEPYPQRGNIVHLLCDAPEISAVKIIVLNNALLIRLPVDILVPVPVQDIGFQFSGEIRAAGFAEAVWENLVDHRALGPVRCVEGLRYAAQLPQIPGLHVGVVPLLEQAEAALMVIDPEKVKIQGAAVQPEAAPKHLIGTLALRLFQRNLPGGGAVLIQKLADYLMCLHRHRHMDTEGTLLPRDQGSEGGFMQGGFAVVKNSHTVLLFFFPAFIIHDCPEKEKEKIHFYP